jgi:hypothetical protein
MSEAARQAVVVLSIGVNERDGGTVQYPILVAVKTESRLESLFPK